MSELVRNAQPKPAKGSGLIERRLRRRQIEHDEKANKAQVRRRDQKCRWPRCECHGLRIRAEVAHLDSKKMGGDHGIRSTPDQMMLLCVLSHQGARSLHSGDKRVEYLTDRRADGACAFYEKDEAGKWQCVGVERTIGVSVPRR